MNITAVLSKVVAAGLFVVAAILVVLPESRTAALRTALVILWTWQSLALCWRYYEAGLLTRSIRVMHATRNKPRIDLLTWAAIILGSVAMVVALP
jgi:hypothetical protein